MAPSEFVKLTRDNPVRPGKIYFDRLPPYMRKKIKIDAGPDSLDRNDDCIRWKEIVHFLDAFCVVGKSLGLGALLPCEDGVTSWLLHLEPSQGHNPFRDKFAYIGFNPQGRSIYLGTAHEEHVYFMFRPVDRHSELYKSYSVHDKLKETVMELKLRDAFNHFFAYALTKVSASGLFTGDAVPVPDCPLRDISNY